MTKKELHVRIENAMFQPLQIYADSFGLPFNQVVKLALYHFVESKIRPDKKFEEIIQNYGKNLRKKLLQHHMKNHLADLYAPKNTLTHMLRIGCVSMFLKGEIDVSIFDEILEIAKDHCECMDEKTRKKILPQLEELEKFKDKQYATNRINSAMSGFVQDIKKLEKK